MACPQMVLLKTLISERPAPSITRVALLAGLAAKPASQAGAWPAAGNHTSAGIKGH